MTRFSESIAENEKMSITGVAVMRKLQRTRSGFTLVELLVAAALTLFIMAVIGVAFQKSIDTFRQLRSVSLMQEKLKSAQMVLKRDLASEHFGGNFKSGFGGPYVRDQRLDLVGWTPPDEGFFRLINGFTLPKFNGNNVDASIKDGADSDGLLSFVNFTHSMHFTVRLQGNRDDEMFYAASPTTQQLGGNNAPVVFNPPDFPSTNQFASRWAEVYYFLTPNQNTANGQQLFTLYRRQRVAMPSSVANPPVWLIHPPQINCPVQWPDISWNGNVGAPLVNNSKMLTVPSNRMTTTVVPNPSAIPGASPPSPTWNTAGTQTNAWGTLLPPINVQALGFGNVALYNYGTMRVADINANLAGDDILLTDVISFEIKANWATGPASSFVGTTGVTTPQQGNQDWPFDMFPISVVNPNVIPAATGTFPPAVFDTWSSQTSVVSQFLNWNDPTTWTTQNNAPPYRARLNALQIRIRVWDTNAQQARQITMIQDI